MIAVSLFDMYFPLVVTDGFLRPTFAFSLGALFFKVLSRLIEPLERYLNPPANLLLPLFKDSTSSSEQQHKNGWNSSPTVASKKVVRLSEIGRTDSKLKKAFQQDRRRHYRLALLMLISLTIHNFPEGLAVGVSNFDLAQRGGTDDLPRSKAYTGSVVTIAIALHNSKSLFAIA